MDSHEAAAMLKDAAITEKRSAAAYSYSQSAPHFLIWGFVWLLGYGAEGLVPRAHPAWMWLGWWWMGLSLTGALASALLGRRQARRSGRSGWQSGVLVFIIWLFVLGTFAILHPHSQREVAAFIPLLIAAIYAAMGLWLGTRYVAVGAFTAAATLGGYYYLSDGFFLWMALVGGGSLILAGIWMRRA